VQREGMKSHFLLGVDIWFSHDDKDRVEAIFAICDSQVLCGEVKTSMSEFTSDQITRYIGLTNPASRFAGGRARFPCTVRFPAAVPRDFPGNDRFVPSDRGGYVLIIQSFRQAAGNIFPVFHREGLALQGHAFSGRLACPREPFTTGRSSLVTPDSDVKSVSPVKPDCLDRL
jgi:hypothetical protein